MAAKESLIIASIMAEGEIYDPVGSKGRVGCKAAWGRGRCQ